jgi:thiol-disulfide isomerase/thioredoxin
MRTLPFALLLLLSVEACSSSARSPVGDVADGSAVIKKDHDLATAPEFDLAKVDGSGSVKSAELRGKVVVVDFWATWCVDCIKEIPALSKMYERFRDKGVEFLGVTVDSGTADEIKPKLAGLNMRYTAVVGTDAAVESFGGLIGFPTTFVLSKRGEIHRKYLGLVPGKQEAMEKEITALIAQ